MIADTEAAPTSPSTLPPLSSHVRHALRLAQAIAANRGSATIRSRHLLEGALSVADCTVIKALNIPPASVPKLVGNTDRSRERTPMHDDEPASVDELHRRSFAEVLADRIRQIRADGARRRKELEAERLRNRVPWYKRLLRRRKHDREVSQSRSNDTPPGSFFLHIHGPWGTGKSTVLRYLRDELTDHRDDSWVVVEFNAWRYQRMKPPWWALIQEVHRQAADQLQTVDPVRARRLWWSWRWWRFRADWLPVILATTAVLVVLGLVVSGVFDFVQDSRSSASPANADPIGKTLDLGLKLLAGLLAAWLAVLAAGRSLLFGSSRAAQAYLELSVDPLSAIIGLFERLVADIYYPIAILIDDLDRCDGPYVVQLLEGIQTLFRPAPVTYVIAADRNWIRTSYEKAYESFAGTIRDPGRPLGHLFLEKLFQLSAAVPVIPADVQTSYWRRLLQDDAAQDPRELERARQALTGQAREIVGDKNTAVALQEAIDSHKNNPALEEEIRAAAARRITDLPAQQEIEHLLQPYRDLVEPNPRAMKRLINAFAIKQAVNFLEHREVDVDPLARWTIIEMRWPLLADIIEAHPAKATWFVTQSIPNGETLDEALCPLLRDQSVRAVFVAQSAGSATRLDENTVRTIVGLSSGTESGRGRGDTDQAHDGATTDQRVLIGSQSQ